MNRLSILSVLAVAAVLLALTFGVSFAGVSAPQSESSAACCCGGGCSHCPAGCGYATCGECPFCDFGQAACCQSGGCNGVNAAVTGRQSCCSK